MPNIRERHSRRLEFSLHQFHKKKDDGKNSGNYRILKKIGCKLKQQTQKEKRDFKFTVQVIGKLKAQNLPTNLVFIFLKC